MLGQRGIACQSLTSDVGKVRRKKTLDEMRTGASSVLIATQLADEGLDIPRLSALVLAMPQRAAGKTIQRLGRIMRPAAGKRTPRLYDLVDVEIGVLQSQAASRRRAYRQVLGGSVSPRVISLRHLRLEVA
jgi:superfamily II DNA or RNA helicase